MWRPRTLRSGVLTDTLRLRARAPDAEVLPIRGELFGPERLAKHARRLARTLEVEPQGRRTRLRGRGLLLARLDDTERVIAETYDTLLDATRRGIDVSPAGAWLLDNFFLVLEHIREIRTNMPSGFYHELPKLAGAPPTAGNPRIYQIAVELISHTDGRLDAQNIVLITRAFQGVSPFTMGELWALPTMLRIALLENVRRMALRTAKDVSDSDEADRWAARLRHAMEVTDDVMAESLPRALEEFVNHPPPLTPAFLTRFLRRIRGGGSDFTPLLWMEQWIAEDAMPVEEAVQRSSQRLALTQLVMSNSIMSLRTVAGFDWREFVEGESATEAVLRRDPAAVYPSMTFDTRDRYRHVIEELAKETHRSEPEIAASAVAIAAEAATNPNARQCETHLGYYLVDDGQVKLERALGYTPSLGVRLRRAVLRHPSEVYFSALTIGTMLAFAVLLGAPADGAASWRVIVAALLVLVPASEVAIAIVNQLAMLSLAPSKLARMDFRDGVPASERTLVVVPLLLGSVGAVQDALDHLEAQYLANRDAEVRFALLGDFLDASQQSMAGDDAIVAAAVEGVRALNEAHGAAGSTAGGADSPFYFFHRHRRWNEGEGVWMGWERKRGKLADLNTYLLGHGRELFSVVEGDAAWLPAVRFVITLDSDSVLPRGAAAALIGTIAHPLNTGEYDDALGRVVRGYGILQPRVSVSLDSANRSRFAAIFAGHPGVDPYTTAVSDVYQDLYGEGTFTGKGIYDVNVFERATRGRFPENVLLSHDLVEGTFARAGLVTDVEVFDDYPARYLTAARRAHRWIRGDWQLLPYLAARVPGPRGSTPNPLSAISRWKIFDNMRRSIAPVMLFAWIVAGWTILPGSGVRWTLTALAALMTPWLAGIVIAALRPPPGPAWRPYYSALGRDAVSAFLQMGLAIAFLPHQAMVAADAIVRTLSRVYGTRRHLLEWLTASQAESTLSSTRRTGWHRMWPAVVVAAAAAGLGLIVHDSSGGDAGVPWEVVLPVGLLWIAGPEIAFVLSARRVRPDLALSPADRLTAMRYALAHWRFFDRFIGPATNWLVPDNYQETPQPVLAKRTSPTNIGLQLLSTISAWDLGFLTVPEMVDRLEKAFTSLERMRRVRGHFYNWYDLTDLRVLEPPYVSTVDSGNLAGHLVAFAEGCLAATTGPVDDGRFWPALDAARALAEPRQAHELSAGAPLAATVGEALRAYQAALGAVAVPASASSTDGTWATTWMRERLAGAVEALRSLPAETPASASLRELGATSAVASDLVERLESLAARARALAMAMDFRLLYEQRRKLFSIGYDERAGKLDVSSYDLLASEARLASFMAVAKGDVPVEHWFRLGRGLTTANGATALLSWSGSMFEYLMPLLVLPSRPTSLLDQTHHAAVRRQMAYGRERGVPWGISESAYNVRDRHQTYQYRAFGVPDLGLRRGLADDLVVAPYATMLALGVNPREALRNLAALEREGALGAHGFYDAVDYSRPDPDDTRSVIRAMMAHHVGMSLVALDNALHLDGGDGVWQRRFMADAAARAAGLLLDERVPRRYVAQPPQSDVPEDVHERPEGAQPVVREVETPHTPEPRVGLLGSLPYCVMLTNVGSGYSRTNGMAVTRWRADATRDETGQWLYVRDLASGRVWSGAYQPTAARSDFYRVTFAGDRVVFVRRDADIDTRMEVSVVPTDRAEVRRLTLTNRSRTVRELEITSYSEVVLHDPDADRAHPAFQNLFVETEWVPSHNAVLASRRPRSAHEPRPWGAHVVAAGGERVGDVTCETDRARFLGRGRVARSPRALDEHVALSGTVGAVLDPVFSLRLRVRIEPGRAATVAFTTLVADDRESVLANADRYRELRSADRARALAATEARMELRDLDVSPADAALYQELAGALIFPHEELRASAFERAENRRGQRELWAHGISGNRPIVLATIGDATGLPSVRQLLGAHTYWRMKGVQADLVILNVRGSTYLQELQDQLISMVVSSSEGHGLEKDSGVFIRQAHLLPPKDVALIRATARIHVVCDGVGIGGFVMPSESAPETHLVAQDARLAFLAPVSRIAGSGANAAPGPSDDDDVPSSAPASAARGSGGGGSGSDGLDAGPSLGHLTDQGDYELRVSGATVPPAPWANVIANPNAGFCVTERGGGYAWGENSYHFRLTPWYNDPVSDPLGEVLYITDAAAATTWTPTPGPTPARSMGVDHDYVVRHAPGLTTFLHERHGIASELLLGVPEGDPVKITRLRLTNRGSSPRRLVLTSFVEWCLGAQREQTRHQLHTRRDPETGAIFAQNFFADDFAGRVAFSWISEPVTSATANREEFIGRNGDLVSPAALTRDPLLGTVGAGYDPCAALRVVVELAPGATRDVVVLLGVGTSDTHAREIIAKNGSAGMAAAAVQGAVDAWTRRLSTITARTPEPEFDAMLNRWSLYQALSCRMWARSAIYQSSGAFGFRDQLQDSMAFVYAEPAIAREHLLRASGRQFPEGDVQHWWHEPSGRGVRTKFSDDLVWLPFVADHYVRVTGDTSVWDERATFIGMRALEAHEHEAYEQPKTLAESATLYDHCVLALERACTIGAHGLPLMGIGDWNDGMNRVGAGGTGVSVWLAWFLAATLRRFAEHASARGDDATAARCRTRADDYVAAVEREAWDGKWYRRAYFDDGTPLGSSESDECQIDAIAQSWAVISGAGDPARARQAMQSARDRLVREDARLIMLLTPPFDRTPNDPGYIKGYVPGVRENGAQYTHAALWSALAAAELGDGDLAFHLLHMINPLTHARTAADVDRYKVEPYVVCADVYTAEGHLGRGGWTWYTGSASWCYRVALEAVLGFRKRGDRLTIDPCVPTTWKEFEVTYRHGTSGYDIVVRNPAGVSRGVASLELDGHVRDESWIALADDGARHRVVVTLGAPTAA